VRHRLVRAADVPRRRSASGAASIFIAGQNRLYFWCYLLLAAAAAKLLFDALHGLVGSAV
jgi:hypothetical protein